MEIGHVVDFIIEYNDVHDTEKTEKKLKEKQNEVHSRSATQADWDAFWG